MNKQYTSQQGFTLVEMLVTLAIMTIMSSAIFYAIYLLYNSNAYVFAQSYEVDHARRGMNRFSRDVKEMTYAEDGSFPVVAMEEHTLAFYSDIDNDNNVEYVEYELATTTLYKYVYNPTGNPPTYSLTTPDEVYTLSEYVQNFTEATSTFFYFDSQGNQLDSSSPLTDVRYIEAQIIVNIDPIRAPGEFVLRRGVAPRNLKDNL
ncbi:MAG: hypothetical protein RLZZ480_150 [Candidatus Parcubacteria bacterium]|jgi:prepilin-type N-terminal cleavage/methylation domain-containing protein